MCLSNDKEKVMDVAAAFLFAGLAPALVAAALWHAAKIASAVFAFTFAIALGHAVLFGLPLFLVFRSKGRINVISCVIFGFAIGAVPIGVLSWPTLHPEPHTLASVDDVPTIINGVITAAGWVNYVKPLIYFGSFGALGGFAFWVALISAGTVGKAAAVVVRVIRELTESFDMSHPTDQIDNSRTKQLQMGHDGKMSSDQSQSDVRLENCESPNVRWRL
jgi:hypothetical protein